MNIRIEFETDKENELSDIIHKMFYKTALKVDKKYGVGVYLMSTFHKNENLIKEIQ